VFVLALALVAAVAVVLDVVVRVLRVVLGAVVVLVVVLVAVLVADVMGIVAVIVGAGNSAVLDSVVAAGSCSLSSCSLIVRCGPYHLKSHSPECGP